MKSTLKFVSQAVAGTLVTSGMAFASACGVPGTPACAVPEPGSLSLVVLGVAGAVVVSRFFKKK